MVLSDTGFWFAFFNPKDRFHAHSMAVMQGLDEGLITTWPVITETCYLLGKALGNESQLRFLKAIEARYVDIFPIQLHHLTHIQQLMQKYVDLADATLKPTAGKTTNRSKTCCCRTTDSASIRNACHD